MKRVAFALALLATPALAQQPQFTPAQQAAMNLGQQLGLAVQNNAELADQVQKLAAETVALKKQIEELKKPAAAPDHK